jgi:hypothetical protein
MQSESGFFKPGLYKRLTIIGIELSSKQLPIIFF